MAPPISKTSAEPTLYDILSLTPKHLEGQASTAQRQKIVKQAYHRALLKHHPDKAAASKDSEGQASSSTSSPSSPSKSSDSKQSSQKKSKSKSQSQSQPRILYTVDQIQHAYSILSDQKQRSEYNRSLRSQNKSQSTSSFQVGVETVDLDDIAFDERTGLYYRSCRCGNARGYAFTEENLEEFEDDGVLMVECLDCSLWIRVLFAAAEDDEDGVDDNNNGIAESRREPREEAVVTKNEDAITRQGERRGSGTGRGFTFNWSFNWGISLSGSVTAGKNGTRG
ncbi:hypothetical protein F4821DRAFT_221684 [Hypoxylon rubiginosum]|uniref:Uncharacterized protein n=1 Tax=Hypoxylon rubiginosum TaxID=110542 RepID=A0ACC0DN55_9PEZI|nr:hypothetical protein F4821DRAFT_221684 [Hypoxylon rubiginosum]